MHAHRSLPPTFLATSLLFLLGAGCASGLKLSVIESAQRQPSNLAVFFTVNTRGGEPVPQLDASQFRIYEDGQLVSAAESSQTILNPEVAAEHFTLLLVDMSGSVRSSGQVPLLVEAASRFTESVGKYQKVAVYAFDGAEEIYPIAPFTGSAGASARAVSALNGFPGRDPSTNLHGAIVRATAVLDQAVNRARTPLRFGTLVVFTDGTDRSGRVSFDEMEKALDDHPHPVYAIGVGGEMDEKTLSRIGRAGHWLVADQTAIDRAFQTAAERIVGQTRSHYLLSYCSPARAGKHRVTIEAVSKEPSRSGRVSYDFDAAGFGPGCDPTAAPPFSMKGRTKLREPREPRAPRGKPVMATAPNTPAAVNPEQGDY
jgi:hypothetical protein